MTESIQTYTDTLLEKRASEIGIETAKMRKHIASLDWIKKNGVLVAPHIYGIHLLAISASLAELGLQKDDPRARRLKGLRRKLIDKHPCAHYYEHQAGETVLGFSSDLPAPPSCFFDKAKRLTHVEFLTADGVWVDFPGPIHQLEATDYDKSGYISKWIDLSAVPDDFHWPVTDRNGQTARWLRLTWQCEKSVRVSDRDIMADPVNNLSTLEGKARASVDLNNNQGVRGYGQKMVGYGGYAWIGVKAWAAWQRDWTGYEAEMNCIKAYLLWRYSEFESGLAEELAEIAKLAWKSLKAKHDGEFVVILNGSDKAENESEFTASLIRAGLLRLPSRAKIQRKLRLDYEVSMVVSHGDIERDRLEAEQLRTRQLAEDTRQRIMLEQRQVELHKAWAEKQRLDVELNAMRSAALKKARQQIEEIGSPFQQMVDNLRLIVFQKMREAQQSLNKNGNLHPKTVAGLRMMVEQFGLLNSHEDTEIEVMLHRFEAMLPPGRGVAKDTPNLSDIQDMVDDIVEATREAANRIFKLNVADDYGTDSVRW